MNRALPYLIFVVLSAIIPLSLAAQSQVSFATVEGYVVDAETEAAIAGAHVFIANSLLGTTSGADGFFSISGVSPGTHTLVASYVGYKGTTVDVRIIDNSERSVTLKLTPRIYQSEGIEVIAELSKEEKRLQKEQNQRRQEQLKKFRKFFLGISRNAGRCTIVNPDVLEFEEDSEQEIFRAVANDALVIDNEALGYRVRFVLEEFEVREKQRERYIKYQGQAGFTELFTESRRERRRWLKNRERAYRGSQRHFLTALTSDRLWEEGYLLVREGEEQSDYSGVPGARPTQRVIEVNPEEILTDADLEFERILDFDGYLKVIYTRGIPDERYLEYKNYVAGWKLRDDEQQQASWLALTQGPVTITVDGKVVGTYGLTKLGYWYFERVAEMVPLEYTPDGNQSVSPQPQEIVANLNPVVAFQDGLRLVRSGEYDEATYQLQQAFDVDPVFSLNGQGTVAYWLGHAYEKINRAQDAHRVWGGGMRALAEKNRFDVRLADAYIRDVFARERAEYYEAATHSYLDILESLDQSLAPEEYEIAHRHMAQMFFLLPQEERSQVLAEETRGYLQQLTLTPLAGEKAASWWRAQDAFPATSINERIVEHLRRVYLAEKEFTDAQSPIGFDDRGLVFVQYGSPRTRTVIKTDLLDSRQALQQYAVPLPGPLVVAPNEFWAYRHVDDLLHFVFLLDGGRYQIRSPEDLIPDDLRTAAKRVGQRQITAGSTRINRVNEAYARALIAAWNTIYSDLALHHPAFEEQVEDLEMYEADLRATGGVDIDASGQNDFAGGGGISPLSYSSGLESSFSNLAHTARLNREEQAPRNYSSLLENVEPLPVAVRAARFLNDDGTTRTELFWSHIPGTLKPTRRQLRRLEEELGEAPDRYLIEMSVVQHQADYSRAGATLLRYAASDLPQGSPAPVQALDIEGVHDQYHLSVQWGQYRLLENTENGEVAAGEEFKLGVQRINGLGALSNDESRLEMSDLKPVYLDDDGGIFLAEAEGENGPAAYPFTTITAQTNLGLYFEIYHLAFGDDDQAHFTVEYEVIRDASRRNARKLTSASTPYTSDERTAKEYIALDLSEYGDRGSVDIRLTVTDDVTDRQVERTISFNLASVRER